MYSALSQCAQVNLTYSENDSEAIAKGISDSFQLQLMKVLAILLELIMEQALPNLVHIITVVVSVCLVSVITPEVVEQRHRPLRVERLPVILILVRKQKPQEKLHQIQLRQQLAALRQ